MRARFADDRNRIFRIPLLLAALLQATAAPQPEPTGGPTAGFGNWLCACDNQDNCTVLGFGSADGPVTLLIGLPRGAAPTMALLVQQPGAPLSSMRLQAGRRGPSVALRLSAASGGIVHGFLGAGEVAALMPALRGRGPLALLRPAGRSAGRGVTLGTIRLAGAAAALDWVAQRQHAPPVPTALPHVAPPFNGDTVDTSRVPGPVRDLAAVRSCRTADDEDGPAAAPSAWHLDGDTVLWQLPCGSGNYDRQDLFVLSRSGVAAVPVPFATLPQMAVRAPGLLVNAEVSPDGRELIATTPERGLGDCGEQRSFRWDGTRFRLVLARFMPVCRGVPEDDWPVVFRAGR